MRDFQPLFCVECEPLLKLHRQLLALHADEIVQMLDEVRETMGAKEAVIGIKDTHANTCATSTYSPTPAPMISIATRRFPDPHMLSSVSTIMNLLPTSFSLFLVEESGYGYLKLCGMRAAFEASQTASCAACG